MMLYQVVVGRMEEHIDICKSLDEFVGEDLGVDVFLTR